MALLAYRLEVFDIVSTTLRLRLDVVNLRTWPVDASSKAHLAQVHVSTEHDISQPVPLSAITALVPTLLGPSATFVRPCAVLLPVSWAILRRVSCWRKATRFLANLRRQLWHGEKKAAQ